MLSPCSLLNSNSSICGRHPMMFNRKAGLAIGCHSIVAFAVRTCMNMLKHVKNCANLQKSAGILCYSSLAIHLQGHKGVQMFSMHYVPPSHFPREHRNGFLHNIIHIYMVEKKLELKVYSLCFVVFMQCHCCPHTNPPEFCISYSTVKGFRQGGMLMCFGKLSQDI